MGKRFGKIREARNFSVECELFYLETSRDNVVQVWNPPAMLNWSATSYKFTIGIGSMALAALMSELWKTLLPIWAALCLIVAPLVLFMLADRTLFSIRVVQVLQIVASVIYIALCGAIVETMIVTRVFPRAWPVWMTGMGVGLIPCALLWLRLSRRVLFGEEVVSPQLIFDPAMTRLLNDSDADSPTVLAFAIPVNSPNGVPTPPPHDHEIRNG